MLWIQIEESVSAARHIQTFTRSDECSEAWFDTKRGFVIVRTGRLYFGKNAVFPFSTFYSAKWAKCTKMFLFVKKRRNWNLKSFQLIHTPNNEKRGKSEVFHKVIHIIHTKTYVFGELLGNEKRTNVLVSCYENVKLSKKIGFILDF